jgi:PAS domain-containing protein
VIGTASANRVMTKLTDSRQLDFARSGHARVRCGRQQTFNRELLETTIESMLQGVSVVDADLRLVAWNSRYEEMFAYPERCSTLACPSSACTASTPSGALWPWQRHRH